MLKTMLYGYFSASDILLDTDTTTGLPAVSASSTQVKSILQIVLGILGAIAVLMLVLAALKFITSQGNPEEVAKARNTIIYTAIGLIVIISAQAIVTFVIGNI